MLLTLKQASQWASEHLNKNVTSANITYLIQYGRIESVADNGVTLIPKQTLVDYYNLNRRETRWKDELGDDLNWTLAFEKVKEAENNKARSPIASLQRQVHPPTGSLFFRCAHRHL